MKITESTTVHDAIKKSRNVLEVFSKYRLDCPECKGAAQDTIKNVAEINGLDLAALLRELNSCLKK